MKANILIMTAFMIICGSIMAKDVITLNVIPVIGGKSNPNVTKNSRNNIRGWNH